MHLTIPVTVVLLTLAGVVKSATDYYEYTKDNTCGIMGAGNNNGYRCLDDSIPGMGSCCSSDGYCGNNATYCGKGCQLQYGRCDDYSPPPPIRMPRTTCGPNYDNKKCLNDECCSSNGLCGYNKKFCGVGCQDKFGECGLKNLGQTRQAIERRCGPNHNNQKCLGVDCCSSAGYCGIGKAYCAVPQECQRAFGRCDSDMFPIGASTLKDPRPQLGKNAYGKFIMDCKVPGTVSMTFDDGPNVFTGELLDRLKTAGAKVTFFVGGNNNGRQVDQGDVWPALVTRMVNEGHQVASHTWSHPHMNAISSEKRKLEMAKTERAIANIIGRYPTYMRPPYGQCDEESGCQKDMRDMGYSLVSQTFDSEDWKNAAGNIQDSIALVKDYFNTLNPESHLIICQHDFLGASVQELTPVLLDQIKAKGLKAVTLGECLGDDIANWYRKPGTGSSWNH